jgi:hypothetical protein
MVRALIPAAEAFLASLKANGGTFAFRDRMTDLAGVNARIGLKALLAEGDAYGEKA